MLQMYHKMKTDKLSMRNNMEDNIWLNIGLTLLSLVESPSCHNDFSLDLDDHKNVNGVAIDLFCTDVIGHPRYMFSN